MTSAISTLRPLLRDAIRVDRSRLSFGAPLRNAIGVVLPLALGAATGHLLEGLTVSTGALNVAFSDRPGPYRLRAAGMLLTGLGGALSVFVGSVTGSIGALAVALTTLWGFAAGLLVALGLAATQVGLTSVILLLVFGARPLTPGTAAATAALLLGGAALQTALSVAAWPLRRFGPQRDALAAVFRQLAAYTRAPEDAGAAPAATAEITAARTGLVGAPEPPAPPQLCAFVNDVDATLGALVQALCDPSHLLRALPNLRADQRALADLANPDDPVSSGDYPLVVIVSEADRITDSVNTMTELARRPRGAKERRR